MDLEGLAALVSAIAALITATTGGALAVYGARRASRRESPAAARRVAEAIVAAAEDGEITPEEWADVLKQQQARPEEGDNE